MEPLFHVLLDQGKRMGPYDRRTIIGLRIKHTLSSDDVLVDASGARLTVGQLIGAPKPAGGFSPQRTGSFSVVQAMYPASLRGVQGRGMPMPRFRGELEIRVQSDVLRIAGRFRRLAGWKEGRVKLPLADIVHASVQGSVVDLWLKNPGAARLQRLRLDLFTPTAAGELVDWLPAATPWPQAASSPAGLPAPLAGASRHTTWVPAAGVAAVLAMVVAVLVYRRLG